MLNLNKKFDASVILMTALLPTTGHRDLIKFASNLSERTFVILSTRRNEPVSSYSRFVALSAACPDANILLHSDDNAPQTPNGDDDVAFWEYWKNVIEKTTQLHSGHTNVAVVASEPYGQKVARLFNWTFIPYDMKREIDPVKSTDVRKNIIYKWNKILPSMQKKLTTKVVLFGPESVGKTTMAKDLARSLNGYFIPEFARGYLELKDVGPVVTDEKMDIIVRGQTAYEELELCEKPFLFFDTDIYSTLGYYLLWDKNYDEKCMDYLINHINYDSKDLYLIMNDQIPFEPDILRYGENKRETTTQYWVDLAKKYYLNYHVVKNTDRVAQFLECEDIVQKYVKSKFEEVSEFVRD